MPSSDGKKYGTDCVNTESMFRIIQSPPSKKAEQDRVKEHYELNGYPEDWIDKRLRGIATMQDITDEWKTRGIQENKQTRMRQIESDFRILHILHPHRKTIYNSRPI